MGKVEAKNQEPAGDSSPAKQVIAAAIKETTVTDDKGRIIKLRKPGVLAQYRLVEMLGDHAATNRAYMGMVAPLAYIYSIDDDDVIVMGTKKELEALIIRLGDEGIGAVQAKVSETWGQIDPEEQATSLKK